MNPRGPGGLSRADSPLDMAGTAFRATAVTVGALPAGALPLLACLLVTLPAPVPIVAQANGPEARATATPVPRPPTIDGVLDEPFWATIEPVTDFRQRDPVDGAPASEPTEVRIGYDANALYFGFVFHDSEPALIRRSILHRGGRIDKDDRVIVALDTYHDRRNAYIFEVGALGTQDDALISDESMTLDDWNWDGVFTSETRVTEDGWVLELEIPFTTIRFPDTDEPTMGIAFMRSIRRKNESVLWPHIGQEYRSGISQVSRYATLEGLRGLRRGRYAEVKPFAIAGTQRMAGDASFEGQTDVGVDVKYALTSNLTFDLTWNTDFAQVESDNVQINLTRFDLFYPEKREFFLERAGLFQFGTPRQTEVFFSRRVGLQGDIAGGGRLTGQAGPLSIGALALRTRGYSDDAVALPAAWNSVVRLRTDLRPRTTLGGIITSLDHENGWDRSAGVDFSSRFWSSSACGRERRRRGARSREDRERRRGDREQGTRGPWRSHRRDRPGRRARARRTRHRTLRPSGHPDERGRRLAGADVQARASPRTDQARLQRGVQHQRHERVPVQPGRRSAHAGARGRRHHQHGVRGRAGLPPAGDRQ